MPYASNDDLSIPVDTTRNVEAFLEKTAIAYRQNLALFLENGWYAIAVVSKNASTLRVAATYSRYRNPSPRKPIFPPSITT